MGIIDQIERAENRWKKSENSRKKTEQELKKLRDGKSPNWLNLDTPSRYQNRLIRLGDLEAAEALANSPVLDEEAVEFNPLERILGRNELIGIQFFERGLVAARAIARVVIGRPFGGIAGHGTGFLISPRLFLTNNHVIPDAATANASIAEFEYLISSSGPRDPIVYRFEPRTFFLTDEELDYTIVAMEKVNSLGLDIEHRGWCPLIEGSGKAIKGERVNIIQHPRGERMQLTVRDNIILDVVDDFLQYKADTLPGSSGSPIFNEQFEVAALHHSGVPERDDSGRILMTDGRIWNGIDPDIISWVANEGTRISRIVSHVKQRGLSRSWRQLFDQAFLPPRTLDVWDVFGNSNNTSAESISSNGSPLTQQTDSNGQTSWLFRLSFGPVNEQGQPKVSTPPIVSSANTPEPVVVSPAITTTGTSNSFTEAAKEPIHDSDYTRRPGYQENFLGIAVPLPVVTDLDLVSKMDGGEHILPYYNFSLVQHKKRRLCLFTAANIDASKSAKEPEPGRKYNRKALNGFGQNDREKWFTDPRIPELHQLPDRFYNLDRQAFNKGHIVRRLAVAWGSTYRLVQLANGDTFHATNCSPQVADFNQSRLGGLWGQLENIVFDEADDEKLNVFAGPVLLDSDPEFEGKDDFGDVKVLIPQAYWKVIVARSGGQLQSFAFLLEQDLSDVDFEFTVNKTWRTRMIDLNDLNRRLKDFDFPNEIISSDQFVLPPGDTIRRRM